MEGEESGALAKEWLTQCTLCLGCMGEEEKQRERERDRKGSGWSLSSAEPGGLLSMGLRRVRHD